MHQASVRGAPPPLADQKVACRAVIWLNSKWLAACVGILLRVAARVGRAQMLGHGLHQQPDRILVARVLPVVLTGPAAPPPPPPGPPPPPPPPPPRPGGGGGGGGAAILPREQAAQQAMVK
jgi:hypothetical protein